MSTKKQEIEALEQIKAIVSALGPDSYLATAFDGAFEDAERNITDDAAYSYRARYESLQSKLNKLEEDSKAAADRYNAVVAALDTANDECNRLYCQASNLRQKYNDLVAANIETDKAIDAAKNEIITLKAKLYDCMVAGA